MSEQVAGLKVWGGTQDACAVRRFSHERRDPPSTHTQGCIKKFDEYALLSRGYRFFWFTSGYGFSGCRSGYTLAVRPAKADFGLK